MTDSVLPQFGSWWRSAGERIGAGAKIPPGASSITSLTVHDLVLTRVS